MSRRLPVSFVIIAIVSVLVGGNVAWGHGGDSTLLHACVQADGLIRLVDPAKECDSGNGETAVDWNKIGFLNLETVAPEALLEIDTNLSQIESQVAELDLLGCDQILRPGQVKEV